VPTVSESGGDLRTASFARAREAFIKGTIGQVTFAVSLEIMGLRGQDVTAEIQLAMMERKRPS